MLIFATLAVSVIVALVQLPRGKLTGFDALLVNIFMLWLSNVNNSVFCDMEILLKPMFIFLRNVLTSPTLTDLNPLLLEILKLSSIKSLKLDVKGLTRELGDGESVFLFTVIVEGWLETKDFTPGGLIGLNWLPELELVRILGVEGNCVEILLFDETSFLFILLLISDRVSPSWDCNK